MTTLLKTWQYDISHSLTDTSTVLKSSQSTLFAFKEFLVGNYGATLGTWTVVGSGDGAGSFGMDSVDRWVSIANIVRNTAGNPHSWITLRSPLIAGSYYYMTFDVSGSTDQNCLNLVFSKTLPAGGTNTARPTAADEWTHTVNTSLNDNTATPRRTHCMLATDGQFMLFSSKDGTGFISLAIWFIPVGNSRTGDTVPVCSFVNYLVGGTCTYQAIKDYNAWRCRDHDNGGNSSDRSSGVMPADQSGAYIYLSSTADPITAQWPDFPLFFFSCGSTGARSFIKGTVPDIKWAPTLLSDGDVEPLVGSPVRMIVGDVWVPTNQAPSL